MRQYEGEIILVARIGLDVTIGQFVGRDYGNLVYCNSHLRLLCHYNVVILTFLASVCVYATATKCPPVS